MYFAEKNEKNQYHDENYIPPTSVYKVNADGLLEPIGSFATVDVALEIVGVLNKQ